MDEQKTPDPADTPPEEVVDAAPVPEVDIKVEALKADDPIQALAGVPEGTELTSHGVVHKEVIVADYEVDENGDQVLDADKKPIIAGWHKEVV